MTPYDSTFAERHAREILNWPARPIPTELALGTAKELLDATAEVGRLRAENERLRATLEVYADEDNWGREFFSGKRNHWSPSRDLPYPRNLEGPDIARTALHGPESAVPSAVPSASPTDQQADDQ